MINLKQTIINILFVGLTMLLVNCSNNNESFVKRDTSILKNNFIISLFITNPNQKEIDLFYVGENGVNHFITSNVKDTLEIHSLERISLSVFNLNLLAKQYQPQIFEDLNLFYGDTLMLDIANETKINLTNRELLDDNHLKFFIKKGRKNFYSNRFSKERDSIIKSVGFVKTSNQIISKIIELDSLNVNYQCDQFEKSKIHGIKYLKDELYFDLLSNSLRQLWINKSEDAISDFFGINKVGKIEALLEKSTYKNDIIYYLINDLYRIKYNKSFKKTFHFLKDYFKEENLRKARFFLITKSIYENVEDFELEWMINKYETEYGSFDFKQVKEQSQLKNNILKKLKNV